MNRSTKNLYNLFGIELIILACLGLGISYHNRSWLITTFVLATGSIVYLMFILIQNHQDNRVIYRLHGAVKSLNLKTSAQPVLVKPDDNYKDLADEINELAASQSKQIQYSSMANNELLKIINTLPVGVMVINQNSDVIFANPQMGDILDRKISREAHPYTIDIVNYKMLTMIDNVFNSHQSVRSEITAATDGTKTIDTQVVYSRINSSFHVIVIAYDISDVINITQMQVDFLRNASHELKTPVTAISGFAKTLLDGAKDDPEVLTEFLEIINQQSDQLTSLINDILTISHIQKDEIQTSDSVRLKDFVDQELMTQSTQIKQHNLEIQNLIDETFEVTMAFDSLQRIVRNLISNAVKYNRDGGQIIIKAYSQGNFWYFSVKDTGIGISQRDLSRIFERFYRSDESRNKQQIPGTGLGLSIVNELVESLSGKITVKSQRGVGSTFTVRLPKEN